MWQDDETDDELERSLSPETCTFLACHQSQEYYSRVWTLQVPASCTDFWRASANSWSAISSGRTSSRPAPYANRAHSGNSPSGRKVVCEPVVPITSTFFLRSMEHLGGRNHRLMTAGKTPCRKIMIPNLKLHSQRATLTERDGSKRPYLKVFKC